MASPKILSERVTPDHDRRGPIGSQAAHRSQSRLETAEVPLDPIVRILLGVVHRFRQQLIDHPKQRRSQISSDLGGWPVDSQRCFEELPRRWDVSLLRHVHVDDLSVLIHRAVHIAPRAGHLDVGLVHKPPVTNRVTTWPGCLDQQRCEALDPTVDRDVVNLDASLS